MGAIVTNFIRLRNAAKNTHFARQLTLVSDSNLHGDGNGVSTSKPATDNCVFLTKDGSFGPFGTQETEHHRSNWRIATGLMDFVF